VGEIILCNYISSFSLIVNMQMQTRIFTYLSVLILGLMSCNFESKHSYIFSRDIPDYKNGHSVRLEGLSHSRDSLKLDTLENGYDSIQIRVWVTEAFSKNRTVKIYTIL
jgi:hypothetical protein